MCIDVMDVCIEVMDVYLNALWDRMDTMDICM